MANQSEKLKRVDKILAAGAKCAKSHPGMSQIDQVTIHTDGYAEPGYPEPDSGIVALGNWNTVHAYRGGEELMEIDDAPKRVAKLLEKVGVELRWSDEWTTCYSCNRLLRTTADGYDWQRAYIELQGDNFCADCVARERDLAEDYLKDLEGDFEHGYHPGQDASPRVIGAALKNMGVSRYLFRLDSCGQFDTAFSVWVHEEDIVNVDPKKWADANKNGPSVSEALDRALRDASEKMSKLSGPGIKVAQCNPDGTADVRMATPEEFIKGEALNFPKEEEECEN